MAQTRLASVAPTGRLPKVGTKKVRLAQPRYGTTRAVGLVHAIAVRTAVPAYYAEPSIHKETTKIFRQTC